MTVQVDGERLQLLIRYPRRQIGKKIEQQGVQVLIQRPALVEGGKPEVLGQSLRFCDSRDAFDRIRGRREGLKQALEAASFTREQRLQVWDTFVGQCRVTPDDHFVPVQITIDDTVMPETLIPAPPRGFFARARARFSTFTRQKRVAA